MSEDVFSDFPADSVKAMDRCWKGQLYVLGCVSGPESCTSPLSPKLRAPRALLSNAPVSHWSGWSGFPSLSPSSISLCRGIWNQIEYLEKVLHWTHGRSLEWAPHSTKPVISRNICCMEDQGVGLEDPYGSLSTRDLLWFCESFVKQSSNCCLLLHGRFLNASRQLYARSQWLCMCPCLSVGE